MASIQCGNCSLTHESVNEVKLCFFPPVQTITKRSWRSEPATEKQIQTIERLFKKKKGKQMQAEDLPATKGEASDFIDQLMKMADFSAPNSASNNTASTMMPVHMIKMIRYGRYAVQSSSMKEIIFVKVSQPKVGKYKDMLVISTRHGDDWVVRLVINPVSNKMHLRSQFVKGMALNEILIMIVSNQVGAALLYAQKLDQCSRCGKSLTNDRSRWAGIGPECEKKMPWIIQQVEDIKGPYVPGAASKEGEK